MSVTHAAHSYPSYHGEPFEATAPVDPGETRARSATSERIGALLADATSMIASAAEAVQAASLAMTSLVQTSVNMRPMATFPGTMTLAFTVCQSSAIAQSPSYRWTRPRDATTNVRRIVRGTFGPRRRQGR